MTVYYHVSHFLMIKIDKEVQVRKTFSFSWSGIGLDFIRSAILPINQTGSPGPVFQNSVADPPDIFCSPIDCLHTCSRTKIFPCFKYVLSSSPHFSNQTLFNFNHVSYSFLLCMMDCLNGLLSSHIWKLTSEKYFRSKWKVLRSRDHGPFKLLRRGLAESRHPDHRRPQPCARSPRPPSCGLVCLWSKCKCKDIACVRFVAIES